VSGQYLSQGEYSGWLARGVTGVIYGRWSVCWRENQNWKSDKVDISPSVRKFYVSANAIYTHTKYVSEFPRLSLSLFHYRFSPIIVLVYIRIKNNLES